MATWYDFWAGATNAGGQNITAIGARQGSFPGMLSSRTFRIVWVSSAWRDGKLVKTTIRSITGASARLRYGSEVREAKLAKARQMDWDGR